MVFISSCNKFNLEVEPLQGSSQNAYLYRGLHPRLFKLDPFQGLYEIKIQRTGQVDK